MELGFLRNFEKGAYQHFFDFINKVVLPRSEKRTIYFREDFLMMEAFNKFEAINLLAIILDHMNKTITVKKSKHGI